MEKEALEKLKYPTGKFMASKSYDAAYLAGCIDKLRELPNSLREVSNGLTDVQLDTPYREGGWSPRQIIHHLADSHINSFTRFKLALTEDDPTIKPYDQDAWAEGSDAKLPISVSLSILDGVHARLVNVLENMSAEDFKTTFLHPEYPEKLNLEWMTGLYAWHGHHHMAQIKALKEREGWS